LADTLTGDREEWTEQDEADWRAMNPPERFTCACDCGCRARVAGEDDRCSMCREACFGDAPLTLGQKVLMAGLCGADTPDADAHGETEETQGDASVQPRRL